MKEKFEKVLEWCSKKEKEYPMIFRFLFGFLGTLIAIIVLLSVIAIVMSMSTVTFVLIGIPTIVGVCNMMRIS